jgi:transcriptional regulator with XRE-family HTH domain
MKTLNLKPIPTLKEISGLINSKGMKRKFLADKLKMTPEYLSNILNGRVNPKNIGETLQRIEEYLNGGGIGG